MKQLRVKEAVIFGEDIDSALESLFKNYKEGTERVLVAFDNKKFTVDGSEIIIEERIPVENDFEQVEDVEDIKMQPVEIAVDDPFQNDEVYKGPQKENEANKLFDTRPKVKVDNRLQFFHISEKPVWSVKIKETTTLSAIWRKMVPLNTALERDNIKNDIKAMKGTIFETPEYCLQIKFKNSEVWKPLDVRKTREDQMNKNDAFSQVRNSIDSGYRFTKDPNGSAKTIITRAFNLAKKHKQDIVGIEIGLFRIYMKK